MKELTIFTPTYNRRNTLERTYKSLIKQTNHDFTWLIVDDGSTDNTKEYIENIIDKNSLDIKYIWQENKGKMQAHNNGVLNCNTSLFMCLDSDDYLPSNTVEIILKNINKIKNSNCAGIIGYKCISDSTKDLKYKFPDIEYTNLEKLYDEGYTGETTIIFKTKIIKQYLFPQFANEKFLTEAYIYNKIDRKYFYFICPEILTVYEYQENGLSNSIQKLIINNPIGYMEYWKQKFNFDYLDKKRKKYIYSGINFICYSLNLRKSALSLTDIKKIGIIIVLYPIGFIKYLLLLNKRRKFKNE